MERVDIAIIGAGPAGLSAAINAKIRGKSFLLFGCARLSAKVQSSEQIENYPGIPDVTGAELNEAFLRHAQQMDITVTADRITGIYDMGGYFALLADQTPYEATALILAMGAETVKPLPGEREFLGRGVSYCATCDGNLYKGKTIAVVSDRIENEEEVEYLAQRAEKVYYYPLYHTDYKRENVVQPGGTVAKVNGTRRVESLTERNGEDVAVDGIFFLKQAVAADVLLYGLATEEGSIVVDRQMATSVKGCFACGDCTGRPYQIAKAVGEGNVALHSALTYLAQQKQ